MAKRKYTTIAISPAIKFKLDELRKLCDNPEGYNVVMNDIITIACEYLGEKLPDYNQPASNNL